MYACIMGCLHGSVSQREVAHETILSFSFIVLGAVVCPARSCGYQSLENRAVCSSGGQTDRESGGAQSKERVGVNER